MKIIRKENRAVFKGIVNDGIGGTNIIIPSKMYPLEEGEYAIFNSENTTPVSDRKVLDIFDSVKPDLNDSFTNAEILCHLLSKEGYEAVQYNGWVFLEDNVPFYHSFVMLDSHMLDVTINFTSKLINDIPDIEYTDYRQIENEDIRNIISENYRQFYKRPNRERLTCGQCDSLYLYIGTPSGKERGIETQQRLEKNFPEHPAFEKYKNRGIIKL